MMLSWLTEKGVLAINPAREVKTERFSSLISGDRHYELENDGTLEAAQRITGHADSRTTKLYDRRGQKVFLEDMERILY